MLLFDPEDIIVFSPPSRSQDQDSLGGASHLCQPLGSGAVPGRTGQAQGGRQQARETLYPDILPSMKPLSIVGGGEEYPKCGTPKFLIRCEHPDHPRKIIPHSCGRPECPICYPTWGSRAAARVENLLEEYQRLIGSRYRPFYVTLSPDPEDYQEETEETMRRLLEDARKMARILGASAVVVIPHGYRIRLERKREAADGASRLHVNRYEWCMKQPNPREFLSWSPHLHLMGWGYLKDSDEFHQETGWVYKKHRNVDNIAKAAYYQLSHAWVPAGKQKHVLRYWGGLSPTNLGCEKTVTWVEETCRVCGKPLHKLLLNQEGADQETQAQDIAGSPISRLRVEHRRYWIRETRRGSP